MTRGIAEAPAPIRSTREPFSLQHWIGVGLLLWIIGVQTTEPLAAAGAIAVVLGLLYERVRLRRGVPLDALRDWAPLFAFVAWGLLSLAVNWPPRGTGALARHLDWLLVPIAAAGLPRVRPMMRRRLVILALGVALIACAASAFQYVGLWPSVEWFESLAWSRSNFRRLHEPVPGAEGRFMAVGLHFHRLKFAHVTGLVVVWAVAVGLFSSGRTRWLALGAGGVGFLSVFVFPYARAAALAVLIGVFALLLVVRHARRFAAILGAVLIVAALAVLLFHGSFRARLLSASTSSGSGNREHLVASGINAVKARPVFGTGVGKFVIREWADPAAPPSVLEHGGKSHNLFVSTAAELGLPGLLLFVLLLVSLARRMRRDTVTGAAGLGTLAFLLVLGLVHDPLFHAEVSLGMALALGLACSRPTPTPSPTTAAATSEAAQTSSR